MFKLLRPFTHIHMTYYAHPKVSKIILINSNTLTVTKTYKFILVDSLLQNRGRIKTKIEVSKYRICF